MSDHASSKDLMRSSKLCSIELPSEKFYNYLNAYGENIEAYTEECNSLKDPYNNKVIKKLCTKMVKFLKTRNTEVDRSKFSFDDCILFNYWIYEELSKFYNSYNHTKEFLAFGNLQRIWNDVIGNHSIKSSSNNCEPYFKIYSEQDWQKRKKLYEFCVHYDTIRGIVENFDMCNEFYEYFESKIELFKHFDSICSSNRDNCPIFYDKYKDYNPKNFLDKLKCHPEMQTKKLISASSKHREQDNTIATGNFHTPKSTLEDGSFSPSHFPSCSTNNKEKFSYLIFGVAISIIPAFIYKFTPLGNKLHEIIGLGKNYINNINKSAYRNFDKMSGIYNALYDIEEHYIQYNSSGFF
ncbi:variable surface protein [Plasmodium gonderi]|uniref:Variable surface protein n=1 Tax=Plasmodium gonderi TaxID=77519 RepID=A0A1Y1JX89_PLAGO|nr:variable surface protein [Plasmodium gonderi]GAW84424.1 variable surface protein [Plasmodium gonderi]